MFKNHQRGFTLIELLVVIAIIGILSSVVLASLNSARKKGRDARRISDLKQIQLALELYYDSNSGYPTALSSLAPSFIATIPTDPSNQAAYSYAALGTGSNCTSYHLGASLEQSTNKALQSDADAAASTGICTSSAADFSGADTAACNSGTDVGSSCYDIVP